MKRLVWFMWWMAWLGVRAQTHDVTYSGRVIFYNVENLFDTHNDPAVNDNEFLPQATRVWDEEKYSEKIQHIGKVLLAVIDTARPLLIGLAEVENRKVIEDLLQLTPLKKYGLKIIHQDSKDERGQDVALLYHPDYFEPEYEVKLPVVYGKDGKSHTRDILYVKGFFNEDLPVYVFVNHWPSRKAGQSQTEPKRMEAARVLRAKMDDILKAAPFARFMVMGDFNDNPLDPSLSRKLQACAGSACDTAALVNLMPEVPTAKVWTCRYRDQPLIFDQMLVSRNLLGNKGKWGITAGGAHIFKTKWLLSPDSGASENPLRTYVGNAYMHGYSDHLPVWMDVFFRP